MLVNLRVGIDERQINRILTNLKKASVPDNLLTLSSLQAYADVALANLKDNFPKSANGSNSLDEFGHPLFEGWEVNIERTSDSVGFSLQYPEAEENERLRTVLDSLNLGSRAYTYVAQDDFAFLDTRGKGEDGKFPWTFIHEGQTVSHSARAGLEYIDKTYAFIAEELMPQIRAEIRQRAQDILDE